MRRLLLFLASLATYFTAHAQTAYSAPGVFVCNSAPANVQTMTPFVLGSQNPANFTVTYHISVADAQAGTAAISGTLNYCCDGILIVYARVTNNATGSFDVSAFKVVWNVSDYDNLFFPDIFECLNATLPDAPFGAFYSQPDGQGFQYPPNTPVDAFNFPSGQIYWYAGNADCHAQSSFLVLIDIPPILTSNVLTNCIGETAFDLTLSYPTGSATFFNTQADASAMINPITNPTAYTGTDGEVVWVSMQGWVCSNIEPLTLQFQACTPNTIFGKVRISDNGTTCAVSNPGLQGCPVKRTFGSEVKHSYTNAEGDFLFTNVPVGNNTVFPVPTQPYMSVLNPTSTAINVATNGQYQADFCLQENTYTDVKTILQSLGNFRPNISTNVFLQVSNRGNTPASGTVTLNYNSEKISFTTASVLPSTNAPGVLTFNYALAPHSGQNINIGFFTPTTTVMGDVLAFSATAGLSGDQDTTNNSAAMTETVVNSYDPNDISVAEGASITPTQASGYLHYIVRFQNTGTAEAFDIRIDNPLNGLLDAETFRPIAASDVYFTERSGSDVSFYFPNIDLQASSIDEPNSHGWVIYEVKPMAGISIGDVISNQAFIYFDTNPAIDTNTVTTTIQQLSTHESQRELFALYPNPASQAVTIRAFESNQIDITITDVRGKIVLSKTAVLQSNETAVGVSSLESGMYFVKVSDGNRSSVKKLIVN